MSRASRSSPTVTDADDEVGKMARVYLEVFSTPGGRIVLADLKKSYADRSSFAPGDSHLTAFREG